MVEPLVRVASMSVWSILLLAGPAAAQEWPPPAAPPAPAERSEAPASASPWGSPPAPADDASDPASPWGGSPDASADDPPAPAAPARPDAGAAVWLRGDALPPVRIVYTGAMGGVRSGTYTFAAVDALRRLTRTDLGAPTEPVLFSAVLAQGDWFLRALDREVETAVSVLAAGPSACDPVQGSWRFSTPSDVVSLSRYAPPELVEALEGGLTAPERVQTLRCRGPEGGVAVLTAPLDAPPPSFALTDWEFRKAMELRWVGPGTNEPMIVMGRPVQETARLVAAIEALQAEHPDALYVDAGAFVDGASTVELGELSRHRPLGFSILARLQPAALVPGEPELVAGVDALLAEARRHGLSYIATNWVAEDPARALPAYRVVEVPGPEGVRRVAFLGILDPVWQRFIPELAESGVTITDPVRGVQPVVDELIRGPAPPDAIIALTTASGAVQAELRRRLRGVDVLAGDPSFATVRVAERAVRLRPVARSNRSAPLTVSLDGLAVLDLDFEASELSGVDTRPHLLWGTLPADPLVAAEITETRAGVYPALDQPLLPAPGPGAFDPWPAARWEQLICEAVRLHTDAHTVLLRDLPPPPSMPGPLSRLEALDALGILDDLVELRVPGSKLQAVLDKAAFADPVACGARSPGPKPDGRPIDLLRSYRVVTTDRSLKGTELGAIVPLVGKVGPLDPTPVVPVLGAGGAPTPLSSAALAGILQASAEAGTAAGGVTELLERRPNATPPLWLARLTQASVRADRFRGVQDEAFAAVPETLATNPSSVTLSGVVDAALEHSGRATLWDVRLRGSYATLQTDADDEPVPLAQAETTDDLRWSTSLAVPAWSVPGQGEVRVMPYLELLYDTELTATFDQEGTQNPLQRDLSLTAGLAARRVGALRALRMGAFANRDLSRLDDKPTEYGGRFELESSSRVAQTVNWTNTAEAQLWASTPQDDASDLRFRILAETRLAMPLARWLAVSTYGQGFVLRGRVPANDTVGAAWMLGAALDVAGVYQLARGGPDLRQAP